MSDTPTTPPLHVPHYRSPREARAAHPRLDPSAPMPKESYGGIVGITTFQRADFVPCQLTVDGGGMCVQEHGRGWIMRRRTDDVEGFIGQDCARIHFNAEHEFHKEAARARRGVRIDELVSRLAALLADPTRRAQLTDGFERQQQLRREVRRIRELMPFSLKDALHYMSRTGDRNVQVAFEYRELIEDDDGKEREVSKWRPRVIGAVSSPAAIDIGAIDRLGDRFRESLAALENADATRERGEKELRKWAQSIEDIEACDGDVDEAADALVAFMQPENLTLLCWIAPFGHDVQLAVARAALSLIRGNEASDSAASKALDQWRRAVMNANDGRRFRV